MRCVDRVRPFTASFILLNTTLRGIQAITGPLNLSTTGFLSSSDCLCPVNDDSFRIFLFNNPDFFVLEDLLDERRDEFLVGILPLAGFDLNAQ